MSDTTTTPASEPGPGAMKVEMADLRLRLAAVRAMLLRPRWYHRDALDKIMAMVGVIDRRTAQGGSTETQARGGADPLLILARAETLRRLADRPSNHARLDECVDAGLLTRVQHKTPDIPGFYDDGVRYERTALLDGPAARAVESSYGEHRSDCCGAEGDYGSAFVDSGICPKCGEHCTFV